MRPDWHPGFSLFPDHFFFFSVHTVDYLLNLFLLALRTLFGSWIVNNLRVFATWNCMHFHMTQLSLHSLFSSKPNPATSGSRS
jgi:hypothetical protein